MITKMNKAEIIEIGSRNNAGYLLEQYGYTAALAKIDGAAITDRLPDGYLDEMKNAAEQVRTASKEKALVSAESKTSTAQLNDTIRKAKVWRRAITSCATKAKRLDEKIPSGLLSMDNVPGVSKLAVKMDQMIKLAEANIELLPGKSVRALIKEGQDLANKIQAVDAEQEIKRLKSLPEAVRNFYHQKGLLLIGIKVLNDAGRELHAGDPPSAAKYNLTILYRHMGRKKKKSDAE